MINKKELIGDIDNVAFYSILLDIVNVLRRWSSGLNFTERVCLIYKKVKDNTCGYLKIMKESINPVHYARIVIEYVIIKVTKL